MWTSTGVDWNAAETQARSLLATSQWQAAEEVFLKRQLAQAARPSPARFHAPRANRSRPENSPMRFGSTIRVIAAGFVAIALALAWVEFRSARQAEASIAETAKKRTSLDAGIKAARDRIAALARGGS